VTFTDLVAKLTAIPTMTSGELATILTHIIDYRETVAADFMAVSMQRDTLDRSVTRLNGENDELLKRVQSLEAALAEERSKNLVINVNLGEICRMVVRMKDRKIDCIKAMRSDKMIDDGSGDLPSLRLIKEVYEAVAASEGVGYAVPSQWNPMIQVNTASSYNTVKREVEFIVKNFYPSYRIEISDE
jgi:uncharacterized protein YqgV (UPF0045/DUF77 family)